jgi:hypothetical protein
VIVHGLDPVNIPRRTAPLPDPRATAHSLLEFIDVVAAAARRAEHAIEKARGLTYERCTEEPEVLEEVAALRAWVTDLADYAGQMVAVLLGARAGHAIRSVIESRIPIDGLVEAWCQPDFAPWPTPRLWAELGLDEHGEP